MNNSLNLITKKKFDIFSEKWEATPWFLKSAGQSYPFFFLFCTSSLPLNFDSLFLFCILGHYLFDNISRTIFFLFGHTSILSIKIEFAPSGTAFTLSSSQPIRRCWRRNCAISRKWYPPAFCNHPIHCEGAGRDLGAWWSDQVYSAENLEWKKSFRVNQKRTRSEREKSLGSNVFTCGQILN